MRTAKIVGLLIGAVVGGYWLYEANLDGAEPLREGRSAMLRGAPREAIPHFHQVLEEISRSIRSPLAQTGLNMKHLEHRQAALKGLAEAYLKTGAPERAEEFLDRARSANAFDPTLPYLTAEISRAKGDLVAAERALTKAIDNNPRFYRSYLMRAAIRKQSGDCRGQATDYASALQNLTAGHLLFERIDAAQDLAWLLASHPDPGCRDGAWALELLRPLKETVDQRYTNEARSRFHAILAAALAETGDYVGAKDSAERAAALVASDSGEFASIQRQLNAYNIKQPWREAAP
jgi:tetratricopeptide (TPR) repeat protein